MRKCKRKERKERKGKGREGKKREGKGRKGKEESILVPVRGSLGLCPGLGINCVTHEDLFGWFYPHIIHFGRVFGSCLGPLGT